MNYGRYQIIKVVGRGSMGVVYQASDPNIDRLVAVKVLRHDRISTETFVKRFLKEAKVIGRLSHPHIVTIYDVGEDQGTVYIAMEYLEGTSLSDLIRDKRLNVVESVETCIQIAETLDYAHRKGVVHRDIKPSNIVVLPDRQIKITDFGIAHIDDSSSTLQTVAGEIMGTPAYMSPEQVLGQAVDGRSDIFSLGVILYELCSGRRPFGGEGKNLATVFNEIIQVTPPEPAESKAPVSRKLSRLIMKLLEKEPAKRIQTGKALAETLKNCINEEKPAIAKKSSSAGSYLKYWMLIAGIPAALAIACGVYYFAGSAITASEGTARSLHTRDKSARKSADVIPVSPKAGIRKTVKDPRGTASKPAQPVVPAELPAIRNIANQDTRRPLRSYHPAGTVPPRAHTVKSEGGKAESPGTKPPKKDEKPAIPPAPTAKPVNNNNGPIAKGGEQEIPHVLTRPSTLPKFAFLKVSTIPKGAQIYIDGALKGTTPLTVKLGLGTYRVRLTREGYRDIESRVKLDKMTEYPVRKKMKKAD